VQYLLQWANACLEAKAGIPNNYVIADETKFLSFVYGRLRDSLSSSLRPEAITSASFVSAFEKELNCVADLLMRNCFPVPGIQQVQVEGVRVRKLVLLLKGKCEDKYWSSFLSGATCFFNWEKRRANHVHLKELSPEIEQACIKEAVKKAVQWVIESFDEPDKIASLTFIETALRSQVKKCIKRIVRQGISKQGIDTTGKSSYLGKNLIFTQHDCEPVTLSELRCRQNWKDKILAVARAHLQRLRLMDKQAILQNKDVDNFLASAFSRTLKKVQFISKDAELVHLSSVENTIKSEVETLFEQLQLPPVSHKTGQTASFQPKTGTESSNGMIVLLIKCPFSSCQASSPQDFKHLRLHLALEHFYEELQTNVLEHFGKSGQQTNSCPICGLVLDGKSQEPLVNHYAMKHGFLDRQLKNFFIERLKSIHWCPTNTCMYSSTDPEQLVRKVNPHPSHPYP